MPMQYYYPGMTTGMSAWMIISTIFWLGLAALAVWALFLLVRRATRGSTIYGPTEQPSATEILRARYARGEIDATTFREMMAQLTATEEARTPVRSV